MAFSVTRLVSGRRVILESAALDNSPNTQHPLVESPTVLDTQFQLGTSTAYWKLDMTPPVLRAGWQTDQSANSKDLTFALNPAHYQPNIRIDTTYTCPTPSPAPPLPAGQGSSCNQKMPKMPTASGQVASTDTPNTPPTGGTAEAPYAPTAKKYQYWAVKLKPYIETQFIVQNKIYIDQMMQFDLTFNMDSFKSMFWADASVWYQYDSTNPYNPSTWTSNQYYTNYRNYFICSDGGFTVKSFMMTINLSIKLRNCYKTLIQSLTDWSNWTKLGPASAYYGLLDYCKASDSESVTVFSWSPTKSTDYNYLLWGNTDNGNPQVDWDNSESGTAGTSKYQWSYCYHVNGNEYELNNGGLKGDMYCSKASPWTVQPAIPTPDILYDRTKTPATCV